MKYVLFIIFFIIYSSKIVAQNNSIKYSDASKASFRYNLTFRPDSNSTENKQSNFILITDKKASAFADELFFKQDSLVNKYENMTMNENNMSLFTSQFLQMPKPNFSFSIYKKYSSKEIIFLEEINKVKYFYAESTSLLNWTITSNTKIIAGYTCQKATVSFGGRLWEAWFTKEIPISDGPYKFCGLPGLIIQANDSKIQYIFSLTAIVHSPPTTAVALPIKNVVETTKESFVQAKKAYELSIPSRMAARGTAVPESLIRSYNERLKKNNNKIELN